MNWWTVPSADPPFFPRRPNPDRDRHVYGVETDTHRTMTRSIRTLLLGLLALPLVAMAQTPPFDVIVHGTISGCSPTSSVHIISVQGTQPAIDIDVPVDPATCTYSVTLEMTSLQGWFMVSTMCLGFNQSQSASYTVNPVLPDSTLVNVNFNCGSNDPCEACMQVDETAPFTAFFTSCSSGGLAPYELIWDFSFAGAVPGDSVSMEFPGPGVYTACLNFWTADDCYQNTCQQIYVDDEGNISLDPPAGCIACIEPVQAQQGGVPLPYVVDYTSCSTGNGNLSYTWLTPAGNMNTGPGFTWQFGQDPGPHIVCLTITDGMGCSSSTCDTLMFDSSGYIINEPVWYDCLNIPWGPNTPGTACDNPSTGAGIWNENCECIPNSPVDCLGIPGGPNVPNTPCQQGGIVGVWNANCECVPNTNDECEAGFWVMQAWQGNDSTNAEPIPYVLWVWNLSSGGTGNYQYLWDFGDGTTSTDPFPTHEYATSGPYTLCLTITDSAGCTDTYCEEVIVNEDGFLGMAPGDEPDGGSRSTFTIHVLHELPTSVAEQPVLEAGGLWPNPVSGELNLALNSSRSGTIEIHIIAADGRSVATRQLALITGTNRVQLDVQGMSAGIYLLQMVHQGQRMTIRFVKD